MKILRITLMSLLITSSFVACKKNTDVIATAEQLNVSPGSNNTLGGIWVGEYVLTTRSAPVYFSFQLNPGGTLNLLNETRGVIGSGSWTMVDSAFNAVYTVDSTQLSYSVEGTFHSSPDQLAGRWQYDRDYQDTGFWYMDKIE